MMLSRILTSISFGLFVFDIFVLILIWYWSWHIYHALGDALPQYLI